MQTFAFVPVVPGPVVSLLELPDGATLAASVTPAFAAKTFPCGAMVTDGWVYDGSSFSAPVAPAPSQTALIAHAQRLHRSLRDGGIKVNVGTASAPVLVDVDTDDRGTSLVTSKVQMIGFAAQAGQPAPSFLWLNADESTVTLTAAQMQTIGVAIPTYHQATYTELCTVNTAIGNSTITTYAGIDTASWPATSV